MNQKQENVCKHCKELEEREFRQEISADCKTIPLVPPLTPKQQEFKQQVEMELNDPRKELKEERLSQEDLIACTNDHLGLINTKLDRLVELLEGLYRKIN